MTFKSEANPQFRNALAETIYNQKYRHGGAETWERMAALLVSSVCEKHLDKEECDELFKIIRDMKFIPGGRYLYYAGRPVKFYNNCLSAGTKVLTAKGWRTVETLGDAEVISPVDGKPYKATFNEHGVQPVYDVTFTAIRGKQNEKFKVRATRNHKWLLLDGSSTEELRVGDVVPSSSGVSEHDGLGFVHGFVFGDGNKLGQLRLCGAKAQYLGVLKEYGMVTYPEFASGDPCLYFKQHIDWKKLPTTTEAGYIAGFIRGWLAADGSKSGVLSSVSKENLEWFRANAAMAGVVCSGALRSQVRNVKIGKYEYNNHEIFLQNFTHEWSGFKVRSIEYVGEEPVYCPFEPVHNQIVIDYNIRTFQCYILKAEEDTRKDWANLSWKSESALLTGGGIGVDYSVYRPAGNLIKRTGGLASGPIPKMMMINEIGRHVRQGGSRRSAIYASLNWRHGDAEQFLTVKDWDAQKIPGSEYTLGDAKKADFNFPAPLDMTNISLNYDTAWVLEAMQGRYGSTFLKNVRQAMKSGEPGFAFNFFDKENETGRNACTEVTSEDDSDVCNLGSINMSRIDDIREFAKVVELGTKFLICGTLEAHLPYEKVYKVREKNRRLGLGLMGVHEWLLQRGYRYEFNDELRNYMVVYKSVSDEVSRKMADRLGVSRPVANRSIAPTGSIGLIAGTTTGIEPVFAVAVKRRYLDGTEWKYQYNIDHVAQTMIDQGVPSDKIESAVDLAEDFERRVKFQADMQDYVDMAISSTCNLPEWGSELNNEDRVVEVATILARYAPRLRGFTFYPNGARGGQPLNSVPYNEAKDKLGVVFSESVETTVYDVCDITGGGYCGS